MVHSSLCIIAGRSVSVYSAWTAISADRSVSQREIFEDQQEISSSKKFLPSVSEGEGEGGRIQAKGLLRAGAQERKYSCTCSAEEGRLTNYVTSELATGVAVLSHVGERHLGA